LSDRRWTRIRINPVEIPNIPITLESISIGNAISLIANDISGFGMTKDTTVVTPITRSVVGLTTLASTAAISHFCSKRKAEL
jgi:hypothetical protein